MEEQKLTTVAVNIISMNPLFYKRLGKPVPLNSDITPGAYYAMLYLKKHESFSMSELGKILLISKPNVTALVNKLIGKGYVVRFSDKQDRRIILIRLSSKGILFVENNTKKYMDQIKKRLTSLSEEELELFSVSLQNVRDILSKIPVTEVNELKN